MGEKIQITMAKSAGFCPGVKNAIDKVLELAKNRKKPIYTLGPLIHNKQVIETLREKGIHLCICILNINIQSSRYWIWVSTYFKRF